MVTAHDIENKQFTVVRLREGYHQDEVDNYLDDVVVAMKSLEAERNLYRDRAEATMQLPPVRDDANKASRILNLADKEAERIRSEALGEALAIRDNATNEAQSIVQRAKVEAEDIRKTATEKSYAEVGRLEEQKGQLNHRIEELQSVQDRVAQQIKAALEALHA